MLTTSQHPWPPLPERKTNKQTNKHLKITLETKLKLCGEIESACSR